MDNLSPICQRYTDVMAHKYYLQHVLFHVNNETIAKLLISITIKLQVLAHNLQAAEVSSYVDC